MRDSALIYAEHRLMCWSKWAKDSQGIGYPKISILYKAMKERLEPAKAIHANGMTAKGKESRSFIVPSFELVPDPIAETDSVVAKLPSDLHTVIIADYFTYGPIEVRAKATRWKKARYCQLLEAAKYAVYVALASRTESV